MIRDAGAELLAAVDAAARRAARQWEDAGSSPRTNAEAVRFLADRVAAAILASTASPAREERHAKRQP
ncbi:hypothetical protein [Streptomyces sp. NBC_01614]|uniref:hypothetical protein n=1 Tax=Streptomyces sp. NBC_01614 TaxID=2975897 RepID=UPI003868917D